MCNFFSCIITEHDLLAAYGVDGHSDLLTLYGINDDSAHPNFVKVEFTPPEPFTLDFEKWSYKLDQDSAPDWYNEDTARKRVIAYLSAQRSIAAGETVALLAGCVWFCAGRVDRMIGNAAMRVMYDTASVGKMYDTARIINDYRVK